MANSYWLKSWRINRFPATKTHPAYAHVTLRGDHVGLLQSQHFWERLTIPLPADDKGDDHSNKRLVELAKKASKHTWHGNV